MEPHVVALLGAGVSVVLDFPANTVDQRAWMRGIAEASGAAHRLHLLEASDGLCLARLRARNAAGDHPFAVTEDQFHQVTRHFASPAPEEGFTIVAHAADG
jgi:predicted kinase